MLDTPNLITQQVEHAVRRALGTTRVASERMLSGESTAVYRLITATDVFYLQLAEDETDNLACDTQLHARLRELGVRVPDVVYVAPWDDVLQRSFMVMTEVPGEPIEAGDANPGALRALREAGHDLALLNGLPVSGFGFLLRSGATHR